MTNVETLRRLREREDEADLYAMSGDFCTAALICREVTHGLGELFGMFGAPDPKRLRDEARRILGEWK